MFADVEGVRAERKVGLQNGKPQQRRIIVRTRDLPPVALLLSQRAAEVAMRITVTLHGCLKPLSSIPELRYLRAEFATLQNQPLGVEERNVSPVTAPFRVATHENTAGQTSDIETRQREKERERERDEEMQGVNRKQARERKTVRARQRGSAKDGRSKDWLKVQRKSYFSQRSPKTNMSPCGLILPPKTRLPKKPLYLEQSKLSRELPQSSDIAVKFSTSALTDIILSVLPKFEVERGKGFGFITFSDPASVDKVLAQGNHELDGKKLPTSGRLTCSRASGGVRATGVNFAVGDYANGVVRGSGEQEREKTQERNDVVGVDGGGGGG
ncbi:RNA-binding protein Musashi like protein Rbp6 [Eufriesea mexicana]|nr:RNA-binding protein Musashi like protein Rbp6 [Eufriesea mexicana]